MCIIWSPPPTWVFFCYSVFLLLQLKNDIELKGTLQSVDQFLNLKLDNISCTDEEKYPHLVSVRNIFIRGSTVRYVYLNKNMVDTNLLQDATRREAMSERKWVYLKIDIYGHGTCNNKIIIIIIIIKIIIWQ